MDEIITRPEPIEPLPSPEVLVKHESTGNLPDVKEEEYGS